MGVILSPDFVFRAYDLAKKQLLVTNRWADSTFANALEMSKVVIHPITASIRDRNAVRGDLCKLRRRP